MTTLYQNFIAGTITDAPLLVGATTVNSAGFANLPVVASPDIMYLALDPDASAGAPEICTVTAHTASATSVTVTRASQSTTARQHAAGTVFRTAFTKADADQLAAIIADGAVGTTNLASNAVTTAKITDLNVTTAKLAADAVTGAKIADNAVDSEHITAGAIDLAHMSANSVDSDQYVDGSVDEVHLNSAVLSGAWTAVTLINGWVTATGFDSLRYKKVGNTVYVYGRVDGSSATNIIVGTLPTGFRPASAVQLGGTFGEDVAASGAISATTGTAHSFNGFFEAA